MSFLLKSTRTLTRNIDNLTKCVGICAYKGKMSINQNEKKYFSSKTSLNSSKRLTLLQQQKMIVRPLL